ncbi:MAG: M48 family metallopeptidase [Mitsuaria chitosanitabida]|jgi:STE24 endopeptidase|uniref:M48 family metallopeptidase n=1 Tax=Roseateles chitosanitabidus TaxID=65048 RepID=UPI001B02D569|nr:M48 family metallopeptidase [Roseateles chitosanitabidus]MBO9686280.1 M48 family metallopeptidase [Roseateles chitosanitabidus]
MHAVLPSPGTTLAPTLAFIAAVILSFLLKLWLSSRQMRHVSGHRQAVPEAFAATVPLSAHQKAADYTIARGRLGTLHLAWDTALLIGWTLLGGLDLLNQWALTWRHELGGMGYQLALLTAFALLSGVLDLPWSLYSTFRLEERFGFNRTTLRLFIVDGLKGLGVGLVLGLPFAALILWLMGAAGHQWWLWAWGAWVAYNLLMMVVIPLVVAPLFNKFEPLSDAAVADRVNALLQRCGFASKGLFVMDGSKRSAHGNAYFTGLGAAKRVVFFDTLIARLNPPEIEAVLAHELGHFKRRHVLQRMLLSFALSLAGFALLGWLSGQAGFFLSLGVRPSLEAPNDALALLLFLLALPPFTFFVTPLMSFWSRKHEFEADAYACAQASGQDLSNALLKLHEDNAGTLTPDPVFARFYYSHPPASERLAAIAAVGRPA